MDHTISFNSIIATVRRLFFLNGLFLLLMSLFRLVFFLYYGDPGHFAGKAGYILKAFALGTRFDLKVIAFINVPVTLTFLVVWALGREKMLALWLQVVRFFYFLAYSVVFFVLCVDFGFYSYFKNHINILIFGVFEDDTRALFSTLSENYNLFLVGFGFAALFALVYLLCSRVLRREKTEPKLFARSWPFAGRTTLAVALVLGNTLAARGSFGLFPLGTMDAEISADVFINKMSLNGLFTLQEALEYRMKEDRDYNITKLAGYEGRTTQAFADFLGVDPGRVPADPVQALLHTTRKNPAVERAHPNVIVIMMEGFGTDLAHYQSDRFNVLGELQKHFNEDTVFINFLSGDVGTIGSLETALMNLPKRPLAKPVSQSRYAYEEHPSGAAWPYKKAGYDTVFLYGGNTGWRNAINFIPSLGFDTFEGEGAMDPRYPRNQWGVYDGYLFDYLYKKLAVNDGKPKFIFAMTTSNHPPYSLPPDYRQLPLEVSPELDRLITGDRKLALERFKTYQYANQKLGELITKIKNSAFGANTIIAVTGDHNFWSVFNYPAERYLDLDGVPFYLYIPQGLKPAGTVDTMVFGSHIDIMPTLYNLSLSKASYIALGSDLLDQTIPHSAFNVDGLVMNKTAALRYFPENNTTAYYTWDPGRVRWLTAAAENEEHRRLLGHYKAALAVTDYVIRRPSDDRKGS